MPRGRDTKGRGGGAAEQETKKKGGGGERGGGGGGGGGVGRGFGDVHTHNGDQQVL